MRASLDWIRQWITLPEATTAEQVADAFVHLGFEVEEIHTVEPTIGELVVGKVLTVTELTEFKKPIRFCTVDVGVGHGPGGSDEPRGIICGAANFVVGDRVVVALPGTTLPGGFTIGSRQTYGRISDGMICSVRELGTGTEHEGILVLDEDAEIGSDAREIIGADDTVIELSINADRGYAMSIRGLARELAAYFDVPFTDQAAGPARPVSAGGYPVRIEDAAGCGRFVTVTVHGIDPTAPAPFWMRRRLLAAGIRSISLAVDITNHVMLEYGHPLHAFDAGKLHGDLVVRRAMDGETLRTLDGVDRRLETRDLVVADDTGAISMARVMGGETTEISSGTTDVVIEAAYWDPPVISRTARRHKLPSEASKRFERGVDPQVSPVAAERAAALLAEYGGGTLDEGRTDVGRPPVLEPVTLPIGEPERLTGRSYGPGVAALRLAQVGCTVSALADDVGSSVLVATPPSWRPDLTRAADLVEEVARLEGYDTIPTEVPHAPPGPGLQPRQLRARAVAADLASVGLTESWSFPFLGAADLAALGLPDGDVRRRTVRVSNPLDADRALLRTTLLPGLIDTVQRNMSRGARDLALYEIGQVFLPRTDPPRPPALPVDRRPTDGELAVLDASLPQQPRHVAAVLAGEIDRSGWWGAGRVADWADAIELTRRIGVVCGVRLRTVTDSRMPWHPGRCASIRVGDWPVGTAGELHPAVIERLGLPARTVAFELNLDGIPESGLHTAASVSPFPPVLLDVALVVDREVPAADVTSALVDGGGELLESVRLFDVYSGDQVGPDRKSLAFSLVVRAKDRTLTAAEAGAVRDAAVAVAAERFGASLRT